MDDHRYPSDQLNLTQDVSEPSYEAILGWMRSAESKAVAFDIWARGNYTRRLLRSRVSEKTPIIVPFRYVDEMRWAYRRLALMGLPVEFIYTGGVTDPQHILTLHPGGKYLIDAGWGYIAGLGSVIRKRGREWFPVIGYSRLMPETVYDWLIEETPGAFVRGDVFVAPAELVGIDPEDFEPSSELLTDLQDGLLISASLKATEILMSLELPYIDRVSPSAFETLLREHEEDLVRFRYAIRKLVKGGEPSLDSIIEEIQAEIAEMSYSDKHQTFRATVAKFGGAFTTFAASVGAGAIAFSRSPTIETVVPAVSAAVAAGAAATLVDLWKQSADRRSKLREKSTRCFGPWAYKNRHRFGRGS